MKKIMLLVLGVIFIPHLNAQPEEKTHFGYGNLGAIGGYPMLGGGYRMQYGYHGFDISGKFMPWITIPVAEIRGLYLLYPKQKGIYLGTGFGFIRECEIFPYYGSVSFDAVAGYQWKTARGRNLFLQVEGIVPFKDPCCCCSPIWPAVTFGIGF